MHTFPPTPSAGALPRERRYFAPDENGNPPAGWKWVGSMATARQAEGNIGDQVVASTQDEPQNTAELFQSNGAWQRAFDYSGVGTVDGTVGTTLTWPDGFGITRLVACWTDFIRNPDASSDNQGKRVVVLGFGFHAGANTLCALVYTGDSDGNPQLTSSSLYDCDAGLRQCASGYQAFVVVDGDLFVRAIDSSSWPIMGSGYMRINGTTGELTYALGGSGGANTYLLQRIVGSSGALAAIACSDNNVRARVFTYNAGTNTLSLATPSSARLVCAFRPLPAAAAAFDQTKPQAVLAIETAPGTVVVSTSYGLTQIVNDAGVPLPRQVAGAHAFTADLKFGQSSFSGLQYLAEFDELRFFGLLGSSFDTSEGLITYLADYCAGFERKAEKLPA